MSSAPFTLLVLPKLVVTPGTALEKKAGNHPAIFRLNEKNVDHGLTTSTIFLDRLGLKRE